MALTTNLIDADVMITIGFTDEQIEKSLEFNKGRTGLNDLHRNLGKTGTIRALTYAPKEGGYVSAVRLEDGEVIEVLLKHLRVL